MATYAGDASRDRSGTSEIAKGGWLDWPAALARRGRRRSPSAQARRQIGTQDGGSVGPGGVRRSLQRDPAGTRVHGGSGQERIRKVVVDRGCSAIGACCRIPTACTVSVARRGMRDWRERLRMPPIHESQLIEFSSKGTSTHRSSESCAYVLDCDPSSRSSDDASPAEACSQYGNHDVLTVHRSPFLTMSTGQPARSARSRARMLASSKLWQLQYTVRSTI